VSTVAAIDCGTNTIRLLVLRRDGAGAVELDRRLEFVRLGQGVDATGRFAEDALERTFSAIDDFADRIRSAGAQRVRFVATSAARDVSNRDVFADGIRSRLGVAPEVISGDEEASLAFAGATRGLRGLDQPMLVMDIGGGSTELVLGDHGGVVFARSLDIGSVRVTERCWHADPPTADDIAMATLTIDDALDELALDWDTVSTWVGVAGTCTSLAAIDLGLATYDRNRVHGAAVSLPRLQALAERLRTTPLEQVRTIPSLHPKRADVIGAGALIADRVSRRLPVAALHVSESDLLDGIAFGLLG